MLLPVSELLFHTSLLPQAFMLLPLATHRRDVASVSCILSLLPGAGEELVTIIPAIKEHF